MPSQTDGTACLVIADTCSFLDVVRSAERDRTFAGEVAAAAALLRHAEEGSSVVRVAVVDVAHAEFLANIDSVKESTGANLRGLRRRLTHADEVATHLGLPRLLTTSALEWDVEIVKEAAALAQRLLARAVKIEASDEDQLKAFGRTVDRRAPARQGSRSTHDCIIAESAIRVARSRDGGETVLLTSNVQDFGAEGVRLDPQLATEFAAVGLGYANTWSEVTGRLGIA
jgi:hypothetical protein